MLQEEEINPARSLDELSAEAFIELQGKRITHKTLYLTGFLWDN